MYPKLSYDLCSAHHCNICFLNLANDEQKKVSILELRRCNGCKLVFYCGAAHQKLDWPLHRELCQATVKILSSYPANNLYSIHGQPRTQNEMVEAILKTKFLLRNVLDRPLHYYEEEITSFPVYCVVCFTFKRRRICKNCKGVSYCSDEHFVADQDRHSRQCGFLQLYYCIYKVQPTKAANIVIHFKKNESDLHKCDLKEMFEQITGLCLPTNPTSSLEAYQLFGTCSDFSCMATICYALSLLQMHTFMNNTFTIFIVGATIEREKWFSVNQTKLFFLDHPGLLKLNLYFIGPQAVENPTDTLNYDFGDKTRTVQYTTYRGLFQTFHAEYKVKPSIIVSFNCGFSEFCVFDVNTEEATEVYSTDTNKQDQWFKGLSQMLQISETPIIFTSFTRMEAEFDYAALIRVSQKEKLPIDIVNFLKLRRNPYCDLRPLRNWNTRDNEDIFFRNGYIQGIHSIRKESN